ncbi:sulfur carrier protein ThiS adenylyltransferase ThiF [Anaeromassilibacillus senegalensis]|uniref:sulfur carrier protein ThiS adenylyltransferase ThiF n=1 Tax=Anaeromassilibacillus senegalensis TaxID=1673717 RepID=UPI000680AFC9|nr:sulfur carrier protein ThiS adenylyltransferase ThiF [Anaeromassilibacillus senegalensis]
MSEYLFCQGLKQYLHNAQLQRIRQTRVGIAGLGGLGSNAAHFLVRCGFCRLTLADFDYVEPSNLNRQFYFPDQLGKSKVQALRENLLRINPGLQLRCEHVRVNAQNAAQLFAGCDIWIEAFDTPACKAMLVHEANHLHKPIITASGIAGYGHTDAISVRRMGDFLYIVGDGVSSTDDLPPLCPRVALVAAKQADVALCIALGETEQIC